MTSLGPIYPTSVALYPYLTSMGSCGAGECPYAVQSSQGASVGFAVACVTAMLVTSFTAAFASFAFRGRYITPVDAQPSQLYLSPDPPPPRLS